MYELTNEEVSPFFERLMALNAITTNPDSLGLNATPDEYDRLRKLEELGIVWQNLCMGGARWFRKKEALYHIASCVLCDQPSSVFEVRDDLALVDATEYQLLVLLDRAGWEWKKWTPAAQRSTRAAIDYEPYAPGRPRVWFSGKEMHKPYVHVLLDSESLFARGLAEIPHGLHQSCYQNFLAGNFALPLEDGVVDAGLQDIEEVDHLQLEDMLSQIMEEEEPLVDELEDMGTAGYEPTSPAKSPQQGPSPPPTPKFPTPAPGSTTPMHMSPSPTSPPKSPQAPTLSPGSVVV